MNHIKLTAFQIDLIELLLKQDFLRTSSYVKKLFSSYKYSKSYMWSNINELEEMGLIKCVNSYRGHIKHKKLFTRESLANEYGIIFVEDTNMHITNEDK